MPPLFILMLSGGYAPVGADIYCLLRTARADPPPHPAYLAALLALSVNSGAYVGEIVRSGIQSLDKGQWEAAFSLGLTGSQTMRHVILPPQAFRRILPPLGNEFIALLKDSSLVSVIALEELVRKGQIIIGRTFRPFEVWLAVAVIFLS